MRFSLLEHYTLQTSTNVQGFSKISWRQTQQAAPESLHLYEDLQGIIFKKTKILWTSMWEPKIWQRI